MKKASFEGVDTLEDWVKELEILIEEAFGDWDGSCVGESVVLSCLIKYDERWGMIWKGERDTWMRRRYKVSLGE